MCKPKSYLKHIPYYYFIDLLHLYENVKGHIIVIFFKGQILYFHAQGLEPNVALVQINGFLWLMIHVKSDYIHMCILSLSDSVLQFINQLAVSHLLEALCSITHFVSCRLGNARPITEG